MNSMCFLRVLCVLCGEILLLDVSARAQVLPTSPLAIARSGAMAAVAGRAGDALGSQPATLGELPVGEANAFVAREAMSLDNTGWFTGGITGAWPIRDVGAFALGWTEQRGNVLSTDALRLSFGRRVGDRKAPISAGLAITGLWDRIDRGPFTVDAQGDPLLALHTSTLGWSVDAGVQARLSDAVRAGIVGHALNAPALDLDNSPTPAFEPEVRIGLGVEEDWIRGAIDGVWFTRKGTASVAAGVELLPFDGQLAVRTGIDPDGFSAGLSAGFNPGWKAWLDWSVRVPMSDAQGELGATQWFGLRVRLPDDRGR